MTNANSTNDRLQVFSISGLSGIVGTSTLIFTPTTIFTPTMISLQLQSTTGFVTVASVSIGTNGASYNNILAISPMTAVISATNLLNFSLISLISTVAAGTGIYVNVTTPAVATTYVMKVIIMGVYD